MKVYVICVCLMVIQAWLIKLECSKSKKKSISFGLYIISLLFMGAGTIGVLFNIPEMELILVLGFCIIFVAHLLYLIYLFRNIFSKKT